MSRRGRASDVRFYFDADILGVAKIVCALRADCTYPGDPGAQIKHLNRPACSITTTKTLDVDWIPAVTQQGLLIVTRDTAIQSHRAEIAAVRENGARMVAMTGADAIDNWHQLETLMTQWRRIEQLLDHSGPFIYALTRRSLRPISLA